MSNNSTAEVDITAGQSASAFAASLVTSIIVFSIEAVLFILLKDRFARIYQPRTYLVPERERTKPADPGWWKWIKPVISTSNSEFVQKCGLDAYFFLRYMRMLLKIFVPAALIILPILLPLNAVDGRGSQFRAGQAPSGSTAASSNVTGLDQLAWGNVAPDHTGRYWAHWLLALGLICWFCYVAFDELRGYIRMRQAYMTSPQHRLRASATTVLVSAIPRKWCTVDALDGLYDVFPGGVRNIWINRNFDELSAKVHQRDQLAAKLEGAETSLIQMCYKKHEKDMAEAQKKSGKKLTKDEEKRKATAQNEKAAQNASGSGLTSGNPHQVKHNPQDVVDGGHESDSSSAHSIDANDEQNKSKPAIPIPVIGEGIQAVGHGLENLGRGIFGGLKGVNKGVNDTIDTTNGFVAPDVFDPAGRERSGTVGSTSGEVSYRKPVASGHVGNEKIWGQHKAARSPTDNGDDWNRGRATVRSEDDGRPVDQTNTTAQMDADTGKPKAVEPQPGMLQKAKTAVGLGVKRGEPVEYGEAFDEAFHKDHEDALWRQYIPEKDRPTHRLPIFGWQWMIALPLLGKKVDTIYYCRKEVARLNVEIEDDQANQDRFPLMNSAFVQFNHQVAAHMACQSLSHHIPKQMAPRLVEIDPNDVIWDNMSTPWWQSYIRTAAVVSVVVAMVILWAIPVAFTSSLSQLNTLASTYKWLSWILRIPSVIRSIIQGVLPATFLGILMYLLPVILRLLVTLQGTQSGMLVELSVQKYYFFFQFVQIFLVVTIANSASILIGYIQHINSAAGSIPTALATNIPKASNYFFSYMLLQALSVSAGALVQVSSLIGWFILAPLLDSTARAKFNRQTNLSQIQWGTFFPVYTNLACIGLIYSVISPLILVFNIITFTLFWFVYRYNTLYVTKFTRDTGGLLYPNAINTTFTGIYMMEFALILLFFLVRDTADNASCKGQAIGMIVILILTALYQFLLNEAFSPLFRYLPITLEDDAVRRDEEFARAMQKRQIGIIEGELEGTNLEDELERREQNSLEEDSHEQAYELQQIESAKRRRLEELHSAELPELEPYEYQNPEINLDVDRENMGIRLLKKTAQATANATIKKVPTRLGADHAAEHGKPSWADRGNRRSKHFGQYPSPSGEQTEPRSESFSTTLQDHDTQNHRPRNQSPGRHALDRINDFNPLIGNQKDIEAQRAARNQLSDALFADVNNELEDLTPDQRDALVQRAFQHSAMRARRPVIWLPRDDLGVSDDEVRRMGQFSRHIWVSNVRQGLDSKGRCVYSGAPPDFSELDVIQL